MQQLFYRVAELLGVKLFKRYWPVNGSYWNDKHSKRTSRNDLEQIQRNTKEYTRQHVQITVVMTIMFGLGYLFEIPNMTLKYYFCVLLPLEFYAFMVQLYNYWKAEDALQQLNRSSPILQVEEIPNRSHPIQIIVCDPEYFGSRFERFSKYEPPTLYKCKLHGTGVNSRYFESLDDCLEFREKIYARYGNRYIDLLNQLQPEDLKSI